MSWKLFLDDVRHCSDSSYHIARSFDEAVDLVTKKGCPSVISFDHDLGILKSGQELTGYDFAKWLCEQDMDQKICIPKDFKYLIHSSNPNGRDNIRGYMDGYLKFKFDYERF